MKELVIYMAKTLVDNPDEVHVTEVIGEHVMMFELRVADGDVGKIIGKAGRTVRAMRTLLSASAARDGKKAVLEVID